MTPHGPDDPHFDGADTVVLYDELAYEGLLPAAWQPLATDPDEDVVRRLDASNLRLLQACTALEEAGPRENREDLSQIAIELERLDFKVNLLLELVGQLIGSRQDRPQPVRVRFNSLGATFTLPGVGPAVGSVGLFRVHLPGPLPQPLTLAARVSAVESNGMVKVRFLQLPETLIDLIDKLAFRRHRRRVAGHHRAVRP